jgi:hypothetical protein
LNNPFRLSQYPVIDSALSGTAEPKFFSIKPMQADDEMQLREPNRANLVTPIRGLRLSSLKPDPSVKSFDKTSKKGAKDLLGLVRAMDNIKDVFTLEASSPVKQHRETTSPKKSPTKRPCSSPTKLRKPKRTNFEPILAYLSQHVATFKELTPAEQRVASEIAEPVIVPAGRFIYEEKVDFSGTMYVICQGIVQLSKKFCREYPKALGAGETFGSVPGECSVRQESAYAMN